MAGKLHLSLSIFDIHQGPRGHEGIDLLNIEIEERDAPEGPIDSYLVERLLVRAMNTYFSANSGISVSTFRHRAGRDVLPIAADILPGRVVEQHEA